VLPPFNEHDIVPLFPSAAIKAVELLFPIR